MIYIAQRLLRAETEADKEEFVRGLAGLDRAAGNKKIAAGLITGYILGKLRNAKIK
jgi:hypothetical protein